METRSPDFRASAAASRRRERSLAAEVGVACVSCGVFDWQVTDPQKSKEKRQQYRTCFEEQGNLAGASSATPNSASTGRENLSTSGDCDTLRHITEKAVSFRIPALLS